VDRVLADGETRLGQARKFPKVRVRKPAVISTYWITTRRWGTLSGCQRFKVSQNKPAC